jgi:HK97 family phage major capsid protein
MEKRLQEIAEERAALAKELEGDVSDERLAEIEARIAELAAEETELRQRAEKSAEVRRSLIGEKQELPENDAEKRAEEVKSTGRVSMTATEVRSTLIATDSLAKPTRAGDEIRDNLDGMSAIIDQVRVEDLTGCQAYEEPYVKTEMSAGTRSDGSANANTSDPVFRVAKLNPYLVNVTSYVSKNINRLTPIRYEEKIKSMAIKALRQKVVDLIVNGVAGSFDGIKIAKNTKNEAIYDTLEVDSATIGANTLKDIVFAYGGNDELGANARLFLTKEDLAAFGKVRGTNEKKALFEITPDAGNPNTGIIKEGGLIVPYTICSKLTSLSTSSQGATAIQTMVYGDPQNFELGLFGPYTIEVSKDYKFAEGLLTIMGECMVGGNIVVHKGFVVVTLKAQAQQGGNGQT